MVSKDQKTPKLEMSMSPRVTTERARVRVIKRQKRECHINYDEISRRKG